MVQITEDSSSLQDARTGAGNANLTTAVYKVNLNCHGCAKKVERAVKACDDCESNTVTVVFGKVDPVKIEQKLEKKTKKKVQLLSVQSRAPAVGGNDKEDGAPVVGGDDKEDKTNQINERKTEDKTKENAVALRVPEEGEVEMYMKLACCMKIKVKRDFATFATTAKKREGAGNGKEKNRDSKVEGDKKEKNSDSEIEGGDRDVKREYTTNPYPPMYSSESYGPYGGPPSFPDPQRAHYGGWHPYPYPYSYPFQNHQDPEASAPPASLYYWPAYPPPQDPCRTIAPLRLCAALSNWTRLLYASIALRPTIWDVKRDALWRHSWVPVYRIG
ncbi:hypothetical protein SLEP1_g1620 [Rubroshorea leprosula]|uniref:HMA domain-containing protein n=1 Tax=Rubroshorea leprosula TaxID=152421 RepID=A0AAV5HQ85_9ROSI|nr:hypothetical protein SLEP1_g1620 [Rubroshorea leprosula]